MTNSDLNDELTIECTDIILREYRMEDLNDLHELTWQPEIYEYLPGWNVKREERANWLENYEIPENTQFIKAIRESGNIEELRLRLGIILKETGEFIGWCCTGIKDELPMPNREIMFGISRNHSNRGYTTQAVKGLTRYLFENTNIEELNAIALIHNVSSIRVIEKSGFKFSEVMEINTEEYNHYKIRKKDLGI